MKNCLPEMGKVAGADAGANVAIVVAALLVAP
jgi:hypothetical protein